MGTFTSSAVAFSPVTSGQSQWLRQISLVVGDSDGNALDLSALRIRFTVTSATTQTLRRLETRIYNLADETVQTIEDEGTQVQLSAGYMNGPFGMIFDGLITQIRRGRESAIDSFVDVIAADGDIAYNWSTVGATLMAGWTQADLQRSLLQSMDGVSAGYSPQLAPTKMPRAKVLYGATRDHLRSFSRTNGLDWHLEGGQVNFVPQGGFIPGEALVVNATTGMVGVPEQTIDGVNVRMLLNPNARTGRVLQIDNASIQSTNYKVPLSAGDYVPSLASDGFYKVYSLRHEGDSRGQAWYTDAICAAINGTAPATPTFINAVVNGL